MKYIMSLAREKFQVFVFLTILSSVFFSCEKTIDPNLQSAAPVLVIEAWINDKPEKQIIQLTKTQPYFDTSTPVGVSGATVVITDDLNNVFAFTDDGTNSGTYQWTPPTGQGFGAVGRKYSLTVQTNGETFVASSTMKRTTAIDSITFTIKPDFQFPDDSYIAEFWATDPKGVGDTYWIKAYKNKTLLNKPSEIIVAYDAGFSAGGDFDGATFIPPIRDAVNPVDKDPANDKKNLPPYVSGDSLYVEINSISLEAFDHLQQVIVQTQRSGGFGALFARPIENVSTNIFNGNSNGSNVAGFFNVSAVKGMGKKFVK
jgi:hypothetical protein